MQSHQVLVGIVVAADLILIETHLIGVLVDLILVFIVKPEVIKKIHKQFARIALVPLGNAREQHDDKCVCLESSVLWLVEFIVIGEILDDIEDGLQHGISFLLFEYEVANGTTIVVAAVHHCNMNYSIPLSLGLHFSLDQRHPHVPIMEHASLADA